MMAVFQFRSSELLCIDIAKNKGRLTLSDIAEIYDLPNRNEAERDAVLRKVKRIRELGLIEMSKLGPGLEGFIYVNKRKIPEDVLKIQFQRRLD